MPLTGRQRTERREAQSEGWVFVSSSNVKAIRYFTEPEPAGRPVGFIEVWFLSGAVYRYIASRNVYAAILRSGSKGRAVHRHLVPIGYVSKRSG